METMNSNKLPPNVILPRVTPDVASNIDKLLDETGIVVVSRTDKSILLQTISAYTKVGQSSPQGSPPNQV